MLAIFQIPAKFTNKLYFEIKTRKIFVKRLFIYLAVCIFKRVVVYFKKKCILNFLAKISQFCKLKIIAQYTTWDRSNWTKLFFYVEFSASQTKETSWPHQ